ncbi:MAG: hypothetical protein HEP71_07660 [Roseivirga sp.]|nr:hypothetical protein [Roseivirga sp.]
MNNSNNNAKKSLSIILGSMLAIVALFQTSAANSNEMKADIISAEEATLLAEIDLMFLEEEMDLEEEIFFEEMEEINNEVKVFNSNNELIGEGDPMVNPILSKLVNQADYLSEVGSHKYYRIGE